LPEELARNSPFATVCGAGELMHQSGEDPSILRQNVTSPNGTTAAALDVLMSEAWNPAHHDRGSRRWSVKRAKRTGGLKP
jgi:pyrroline-5-carboxylate reductase